MKTTEYTRLLKDAYKVGIYDVVNNVNKRGAVNTFVSNIRKVYIGQNVLGLEFTNGKFWIIDVVNGLISKNHTTFSDIPLKRGTMRNIRGRRAFNIDGIGNDKISIAFAKLIAICNDLVLNNFNTRDDYELMDGAHMDGSGSGRCGLSINDSVTNIELADKNLNSKHDKVWSENFRNGIWLKCKSDDNYIDWFRQIGILSTKQLDELTISQCHLDGDQSRYILQRQDVHSPYVPIKSLTKTQYLELI